MESVILIFEFGKFFSNSDSHFLSISQISNDFTNLEKIETCHVPSRPKISKQLEFLKSIPFSINSQINSFVAFSHLVSKLLISTHLIPIKNIQIQTLRKILANKSYFY